MWFVDFMVSVFIFLIYLLLIISLLSVSVFNIYLLPITVPLMLLLTVIWDESLRSFH